MGETSGGGTSKKINSKKKKGNKNTISVFQYSGGRYLIFIFEVD